MEYKNKKIPFFKRIPWKKIGKVFLVVLAVFLFFGAGYGGAYLWEKYFSPRRVEVQDPSQDWEVYKNEKYGLGLLYPQDWKVEEASPNLVIFSPKPQDEGGEGEEKESRNYISLSFGTLPFGLETPCSKSQEECSFHANGILGDRIETQDEEIIAFLHEGVNITFTLHKYEDSDFLEIFEEMGKSLRFVTSQVEENEES